MKKFITLFSIAGTLMIGSAAAGGYGNADLNDMYNRAEAVESTEADNTQASTNTRRRYTGNYADFYRNYWKLDTSNGSSTGTRTYIRNTDGVYQPRWYDASTESRTQASTTARDARATSKLLHFRYANRRR